MDNGDTAQDVYKDGNIFSSGISWSDASDLIRSKIKPGDIYEEQEDGFVYFSATYEEIIQHWMKYG